MATSFAPPSVSGGVTPSAGSITCSLPHTAPRCAAVATGPESPAAPRSPLAPPHALPYPQWTRLEKRASLSSSMGWTPSTLVAACAGAELAGRPVRAEDMKASIEGIHSAFPDAQVTIEDQVAEGDKVVSRYTVSGTHQGEIMGAAPTGRLVTHTGHQTDRISGGKIVESWTDWDALGLLQEIGAISRRS